MDKFHLILVNSVNANIASIIAFPLQTILLISLELLKFAFSSFLNIVWLDRNGRKIFTTASKMTSRFRSYNMFARYSKLYTIEQTIYFTSKPTVVLDH